MTAQQSTPPQAALVAIDIAKNRHEVLIDPGPGMRRRRLTVLNARAEHDRLVATLAGLGKPVMVGFEPTGNYHRSLAHRLIAAGFEARLISSMALARTREALHNGWDKNDPKDAQVILHMLRIGASTVYNDPGCGRLNDLQELSKTHDMVSRAKTELWHRLLTHYLPLYFPEAERFQGNSRSDWFLALLEQFPTPASITAFSKDAFVEAAWDLVGRKVSKARLLADIYETARSSMALPVQPDSPAIAMFRLVLAEGRSLIRQRDQIEAQAEVLLAGDADASRLRQLPGIGPIIALTILAEAGDLRRFGHHRQFLKFCGFDLATHQSGMFRGQTRLSKFGNARLHVPSGWWHRWRSASARTHSRRAIAATLPGIPTTSISAARRSPPSPPRWRASRMQSSAPELTIGRSMSGRCQVEGPRSDAAVRAQLTL